MPWLGLGIVLALMLFQCNSMSIPDQSVTTGSSLSNSENENPLSVAFHQLTSGLKAVEAIVVSGHNYDDVIVFVLPAFICQAKYWAVSHGGKATKLARCGIFADPSWCKHLLI